MRITFHCDSGCGKTSEAIESQTGDQRHYPKGWFRRHSAIRTQYGLETVVAMVCSQACAASYDAGAAKRGEFHWEPTDTVP